MYDILTMAAVADELSDTIVGGRIQRTGLVDRRTIALEIYAGGHRRTFVASAGDANPRMYLAPAMPSIDADLVTPFSLLMRKYLRGGVIIGVDQPPLERSVRISIAKHIVTSHERRLRREEREAGESGLGAGEPALDPEDNPVESILERLDQENFEGSEEDEGERDATYVHLIVEIMGRHSNLILLDDDDRIMESVKRVTPAMSRVRSVLPRLAFTPPPPTGKADPRRMTAASAIEALANAKPATTLAKWLPATWQGISPDMAREVAFLATGDVAVRVQDVTTDQAGAIARETRHLLEPLLTSAWAPHVYRESDEETGAPAAVVAYSMVPMAHLAATLQAEAVSSPSEAVARAGAPASGGGLRHGQRRARLLDLIGAQRDRQERKLASVRAQGARAAETDLLRAWGEAIYANLWQIAPGQTELVIDGLRAPLEPGKPAKETAKEYFDQYRRALAAAVHQEEQESVVAAELAHLDQLTTLVAQAAGFAELEQLAAEWEDHAGPTVARPRKRPALKRPRPLLDVLGNAVYIGHTAYQNDQVTFDIAGPNDTWLHARGVAGSHVVIVWRSARDEERGETVDAAAALAAYYSAGRESNRVEVDITRRRFVRKIKGGGPGLVTYRDERTIAVRPEPEAGVAAILSPASARERV